MTSHFRRSGPSNGHGNLRSFLHVRGYSRAPRFLLLMVALSGCAVRLAPIDNPPQSLAVTTTGFWRSMMYLARTDSGVVVFDLGWMGAEGTLVRALDKIGARPEEVRMVLLTHSHRDHVAGWRKVRQAKFVMAAPEVPAFTGQALHKGLIPRIAEALFFTDLPEPGEVDVRAFSRDTTFPLGSDTVRAYLIPGHTAGSAAYLFRGILFVGDALTWTRRSGFRPVKRIHSDDSAQNRESVAALWGRLPLDGVEWVCTAHGRCFPYTPGLPEESLK